MKTLTCKQMGGECDKEITADTSSNMAKNMTAHVMEAHPDTAKKFSTMTDDEHEKWEAEFHKSWDNAPDSN